MAKTLKRKKQKKIKKNKLYRTRKFKNKLIKKLTKKKIKKKFKGGSHRLGVVPALINTDKDNAQDPSPLTYQSSYSSDGSTNSDFTTGVRNTNSEMSSNLRKKLVGEPKLMSLDEVQKEANIRRKIQELKYHSNPLRQFQGHMWGLLPRTMTDNRLRQTAVQSLPAASAYNRSSSSASSPSFDSEYDDHGETKSEFVDPLKTTEV